MDINKIRSDYFLRVAKWDREKKTLSGTICSLPISLNLAECSDELNDKIKEEIDNLTLAIRDYVDSATGKELFRKDYSDRIEVRVISISTAEEVIEFIRPDGTRTREIIDDGIIDEDCTTAFRNIRDLVITYILGKAKKKEYYQS